MRAIAFQVLLYNTCLGHTYLDYCGYSTTIAFANSHFPYSYSISPFLVKGWLGLFFLKPLRTVGKVSAKAGWIMFPRYLPLLTLAYPLLLLSTADGPVPDEDLPSTPVEKPSDFPDWGEAVEIPEQPACDTTITPQVRYAGSTKWVEVYSGQIARIKSHITS